MHRAPLDGERLRASLSSRWPQIQVVGETASTNADLLAGAQLSGAVAAHGQAVLAAEHQVAGRGRLDRTWASAPRAGLTFSVRLRPGVPVARWGWLPLLAGVALCTAVGEHTGVETTLKWPNDLLTAPSGRKLAGILAQTAGDAVVIGIGLNVSSTRPELPVDTASSLALEGAGDIDRTALLTVILQCLDARFAQWADCGGDAAACGLAASYRARCSTIGTRVRASFAGPASGSGVLEADAVDIDALGRLVLRTADGDRVVGAGDVEHLRPAGA